MPPSPGAGSSSSAAVSNRVVHLDAEGVGDLLQAGEVDATVAVGLPALDLLLGDADSIGERRD